MESLFLWQVQPPPPALHGQSAGHPQPSCSSCPAGMSEKARGRPIPPTRSRMIMQGITLSNKSRMVYTDPILSQDGQPVNKRLAGD